jgi:hypothetical protein
MLKPSSNLINIKVLIGELEYKRNNDTTSIGLMAYSGLNNTQLIPELCRLLQRTFNLAECGFFWSDSQGSLLDAWCTAPQFLNFNTLMSCAQYQASGHRTWPTFTENVLMGAMCGYLLPFQNERFYASEHYKAVYQPMGVRHLLDVVLHDGHRPFGAFLLMRTTSQGTFTPDERSFLAKLIPTLTAAFCANSDHEVSYSDQTSTGFASISREGSVRFMDAKAASVVWALSYDKPGAFAQPNPQTLMQHLHQIIRPYWNQVLAGERFSWTIQNRWGRFNLAFSQHHESPDIILHLSKHTPLHTHLITKLHTLNLPPMRQMVAWLLTLNHSRQQIADALGITQETATSHIKTLYKETNTQSGHGLLLKLIG